MKWYYKIGGGHTHVRVFMDGGCCGDLCFRNEEFVQVKEHCPWIQFIDEDESKTINTIHSWAPCSIPTPPYTAQ